VFVALGPHRYDVTHRALVMGILNRTPDSFYDKGATWDWDAFLRAAERLVADGADFLDVGGVKAGPGPEVTEGEELDRVVPAVAALVERFDLPISVDTFRAAVAREAYATGAVIGNDISGFADPGFLPSAAAAGASVVATHVRLAPRVPDPDPAYEDVSVEVCRFLADRAQRALDAGIPTEQVMVDAGLDLGKSPAQSALLLRHSGDLVDLGFCVFLSASNKRFLGELVGTEVHDRREASLAAHALGIALGCRILRAHDVRGSRRVADVMAAILEAREGDTG
jgi:dihydropteroate synthase